ncbi:uncharacterized protein SPPG_01548 [Spizellomyces punctatus DAOM BR117]|uniref:PH domain-containing protein n=1 Tax=Spizellomyces punctatus (strain DAOM BR117) TaxID=645134 RepID=A0A0L0HTB9_SPIPD|nr:uncharacterized protein SPPG_01548 [Spizellomyces punctatus DAOM BR117]KND04109.1 hypothetical protein SPPG_01548 [Spizellomyces punctatus DAOM BR117]|eukprot:XP_016612148.1 hypothetical protein SPPG_01548 [Spizellomyces punctatus DAOM BR117]
MSSPSTASTSSVDLTGGLSDYAKLLRSFSQDGLEPMTQTDKRSNRDSGFAGSLGATASAASLDNLMEEEEEEEEEETVEEHDEVFTDYLRTHGRKTSQLSMTVDDLLRELDSTLKVSSPLTTPTASPSRPRAKSGTMPMAGSSLPTLKIPTGFTRSPPSAPIWRPPQTPPPPPPTASLSATPTASSYGGAGTAFPFPNMLLPETPAARSGFVQKQAQNVFGSTWKRRYLVLDRGTLYLFRTKGSQQTELGSMLRITPDTCVRVSENGLWVLEILGSGVAADLLKDASDKEKGTKKMWVIKCDGKDDMVGWLEAVRAAIKQVPVAPPSPMATPPTSPKVNRAKGSSSMALSMIG